VRLEFKKPVFVKEKKLIQVFPEVCKYSCSKDNEKRNFIMTREYYEIKWGKISIKFLESIRLTCDNCQWTRRFPGSFAKKVFKNGVKSHLLIRYSKSPIITSRLLNFWGSLWRIWLVSIGLILMIMIFRFYTEPVQVSTPKEIAFQDLYNGANIGELVTVKGKVDYTYALSKEVFTNNSNNTLVEEQVYLPLFSTSNINDFVVIKGGKEDVEKVRSRQGVSNHELLKNQDYTVTGRLESIGDLKNENLAAFFKEELPKAKSINVPQVLINSADVKTLREWAMGFVYIALLMLFCFGSAVYMQAFIDKRLFSK
jgi:hypothetical protein